MVNTYTAKILLSIVLPTTAPWSTVSEARNLISTMMSKLLFVPMMQLHYLSHTRISPTDFTELVLLVSHAAAATVSAICPALLVAEAGTGGSQGHVWSLVGPLTFFIH
jgi:hypothetical protein